MHSTLLVDRAVAAQDTTTRTMDAKTLRPRKTSALLLLGLAITLGLACLAAPALAASGDSNGVATAAHVQASAQGVGAWVSSMIAAGKDKMDNLEEVLLQAGYWGPVYVFCIYMVTTVSGPW